MSENVFHRLRLRQLQLVCVIAQAGSIRSACERLHASAPALSKSLREVERLTGAALFVRSAHGMQPTPAGESFVAHARAILERVPGLRVSARNAVPPRSTLRVGSAPFIAWHFVPLALSVMKAQGELPKVQFIEARVVTLAEMLIHGDIDAILALLTPEAVEVLNDPNVVVERFCEERLVVVAPRGEKKLRATWRMLAERPWILPPSPYSARILLQRAMLQAGVLPPDPFFETHNVPSTLAMVRQGLGFTAAFESTVRGALAQGDLTLIKTETELGSIPLGIAYRKGAAELGAIQSLRHALESVSSASPAVRAGR